MVEVILKNNLPVIVRFLDKDDAALLFDYFDALSAESRSRFGPHSFDKETVTNICENGGGDTLRYIAIAKNRIVAYMLVKKGMLNADAGRYVHHNVFPEIATTVKFAPSVADEFQNTGLGSKMFAMILEDLKEQSSKNVVLWGGVQATNERAVHFYEKHGFKRIANFWHDDKDNIDMMLSL